MFYQLSENSHQGFDGLKAALYLGSTGVKSNTASGLQLRLRSTRIGSGKERDAETGLDYFEARYYSAAQGRFLCTDPLMASAITDEPQSWNRYSYVSNNPLRYVDDDGKMKREKGKLKMDPNPYASPQTVQHAGTGKWATLTPVLLYADNLDPIEAFMNESGDPEFDTNCHGTTFAEGKYWINGNQVDRILFGDKYKENKGTQQVNDVAIHRGKKGDIVHSETVVETKDGKATQVRSEGGLETNATIKPVTQGPGVEYWSPPKKKEKKDKPMAQKDLEKSVMKEMD